MNGKESIMQAERIGKQNQQDILLDEMLREKAAVLSRAGFAVEDALHKIMKIGRRVEQQINDLSDLRASGLAREKQTNQRLIFERVNSSIDEYNEACRKADLQYYYLIVTREAMGLRRHDMVRKIYSIPPKMKKLQAF